MATTDDAKPYDIPKKHKAAVYDKPGSISTKVVELDTPEPGAGEVLIRLYVPVGFVLLGLHFPHLVLIYSIILLIG
jgi:hypothetical protein